MDTTPKGKMKKDLLFALIPLAISFGVPAFAQQASTADPQLTQAVQAAVTKFGEALKNKDAAAVAALFTEDGVVVATKETVSGQKAIEQFFTKLFEQEQISDLTTTLDENSPRIGKDGKLIWVTGVWSATVQRQDHPSVPIKGYFSSVGDREGDAVKILNLEEFRSTASR
jgi:uncharacterized protein (TIGR02246 family)